MYASLDVSLAELGLSVDNPYGLPAEIFEDFSEPVKAHSGIKFLRTQSQLTSTFDDLHMRKKETSGNQRNSNGMFTSKSATFAQGSFASTAERPSSSNAAMGSGKKKIPGQRVNMARPYTSTNPQRKRM